MELISIVVPVYNVKPYLKNCIRSILNQTYKNLEIILVDDGSTDGSGEICDEFLDVDKRIRVFHKENGGLSDARNYGIKQSRGSLIGFIDSDDFIDKNMYQILYKNMKDTNADISICNHKIIWSTEEVKTIANNIYEVFSPREALQIILSNKKFHSNAWDKLYKKSLFNDIEYPVGMIYEDIATTYKLISKSKKIVYSPYIGYYYFQREGSIIHSGFNENQMDMIRAYENMIQYLQNDFSDLTNNATAMYVNANIIVLKEMFKEKYLNSDLENKLISNIKEYLGIYINSEEYSIKHKLFALASIYCLPVFKGICTILKKIA